MSPADQKLFLERTEACIEHIRFYSLPGSEDAIIQFHAIAWFREPGDRELFEQTVHELRTKDDAAQ